MTTTPTTVTPTTSSTTTLPTTSKTTITTTISTLLIQRCRLSSDLTPINNCMGYIRCINGIRIELECPSGITKKTILFISAPFSPFSSSVFKMDPKLKDVRPDKQCRKR